MSPATGSLRLLHQRATSAAACCCGLVVAAALAAEPSTPEPDYADDLPRIPQVAAADALATMEVADGFALSLAAAEPLLASPVAIDWDEDGRLFVCEMRGYSEDEAERLGRIRLLHDDDRDGRYDRAEVFAEGLAWPTAICCWGGGVFVGDAPDIFFLRDTDGDGRADEKRHVFAGFGTGNVQGLFNSFRVGIDNRIYGSASSTGGEVRRIDDGEPVGEAVMLRGRDFSFDPRRMDLRPETGGAQHGMSFDDTGQRYVCSNSDHAIRCMLDDRYLGRNPDYPAPSGRESIAVEGPQAAVFRASPVEPWRVLRTRLRASGIEPGIVEGGGRPAGYFTSATGITVARGDAVGELRGMLVVGDVGSNLVHRKRLRRQGSGVRAERVDAGHELIASRDIWFRPVQFANGPDGALWIIDMQREVIEHPKSLPPSMKQHLDLTSGRDTGRLWRLTAADIGPQPLPPSLGEASVPELVSLLSHPNAWQRETAQRLMVNRDELAAIEPLRQVLTDEHAEPLGRLHALWTLAGLEALEVDDCLAALAAEPAMLRAAAVRVSEAFLVKPRSSVPLVDALGALARDEPDRGVRLQVACTAGFVENDTARREILDSLLMRDGDDRWCRVASCSSMRSGDAGVLARQWITGRSHLATAAGRAVVPELFAQIGRRGDAVEIEAAIAAIAALATASRSDTQQQAPLQAAGLYRDLALAMAASGKPLQGAGDAASGETASQLAAELAAACCEVAVEGTRPAAVRAEAARGIGLAGLTPEATAVARQLLQDDEPAVAAAAVEAVERTAGAAADALLVAAVSEVADSVRAVVLAAAVRNAGRAGLLLDAVAEGHVQQSLLGQATLDRLWRFPDSSVRTRAAEVLGPPPPADRQPMVNAYRASLPEEPGSPDAGRAVFRQHCVSCHRVEGVGRDLGPNLAAMQARGPEAMLLGILDPNREVLPAFTSRTAVCADGRVVTGVLAAEGDASITLRTADGEELILARDDIDELLDTGRSLMPEGFERSIDPDEMANLLAYLMQAR
jgi:putative membrane-bound dehydrogenase-like protein